MISPRTLRPAAPTVARTAKDSAHLADVLRDEAALELGIAFADVSGEQINRAGFPGISRHGVSRAINGCASNPLYRVAALFVLMRRLGFGRERALRLIGFLQEIVDLVWPPSEEECPRKVLEEEQRLDALDDGPQQRLAWGCRGAAAEMLEAVRQQYAHAPRVLAVLRRLAAAEQA